MLTYIKNDMYLKLLKLIFAFVFFFICFQFIFCNANKWETYYNDQYHFSIQYPRGWEINNELDNISHNRVLIWLRLISPKKFMQNQDGILVRVTDYSLEEIKKTMPPKFEEILVDGVYGYKFDYLNQSIVVLPLKDSKFLEVWYFSDNYNLARGNTKEKVFNSIKLNF